MYKKEWIAMLLAGGQGSRLGALTHSIAKPALSFGGKYRIIDFSLSNCVNSNIDTVGVLTQYKPLLLNAYIGIGSAWDLDNSDGGVHLLQPYVGEEGGRWYKGTANAIYENIDFIDEYNPEFVLIISGDHIYSMNYEKMLEHHKGKKADVTISVLEVPWGEASRFGIITTDKHDRIVKFTEKPKQPDSNLASMGIYIFNWQTLRKALNEDEQTKGSEHDFGKNILPMLLYEGKRIFSYRFQGYWQDVGTIESYYEANMELLKEQPRCNIYNPKHPIFSNNEMLPPQYIGARAKVHNCLVGNGCTILGEIRNSVIAPGVFVDRGAKVEESILLPNAKILNKAKICKAIVGEEATVEPFSVIGPHNLENLRQAGITVIENKIIITEGSHVCENKKNSLQCNFQEENKKRRSEVMAKMIGMISCNYRIKDPEGLKQGRPIAAMPFGGRYRLLDSALSSMANSGIRTVGLIAPYNYRPILDHIGAGKEWSLDRKVGGLFILPGTTHGVYPKYSRFTLKDIMKNVEFLEKDQAEYVIMSGCSNIFNIDFRGVLRHHERSEADITLLYKEIILDAEEDSQGVVIETDKQKRVIKLDPTVGKEGERVKCFADVLIMKRVFLLKIITGCQNIEHVDLLDVIAKNITDINVGIYKIAGYLGRIYSKKSYFQRNMELLERSVQTELFMGKQCILTRIRDNPPTKYGSSSMICNSMISSGCVIQGSVSGSIIFRGVRVESDASITNCVVMQRCVIGERVVLENVILDKYALIKPGTVIKGQKGNPVIINKNQAILSKWGEEEDEGFICSL